MAGCGRVRPEQTGAVQPRENARRRAGVPVLHQAEPSGNHRGGLRADCLGHAAEADSPAANHGRRGERTGDARNPREEPASHRAAGRSRWVPWSTGTTVANQGSIGARASTEPSAKEPEERHHQSPGSRTLARGDVHTKSEALGARGRHGTIHVSG